MRKTYFVDSYWPGVHADQLEHTLAGLADARRGNERARWLDSILIPEDEIVLLVFEGSSPGAVRAVANRAGLPS